MNKTVIFTTVLDWIINDWRSYDKKWYTNWINVKMTIIQKGKYKNNF